MPGTEQDPALEDALDELYAAPPTEFVLTRARLERDLRDAGKAEAAAAIKRLRKPNLAVWAVNRLARDDPDAIHELLASTEAVRTAQHGLLDGGSPDAMRDEARGRHELIDDLADQGMRLLIGHAPKPATYRDDIAALLEASSIDPEASELLRTGRLTRVLTPPAGFDALGDAPPGPVAPLRPTREGAPQSRKAEREAEAARGDVETARARADEASEAADEAEAEAASADIAADTAAAHVTDVERALEQARSEQLSAARRAKDGGTRARAARRSADEANERLRRAEERARQLET